ncbi:family 20 glycosylhydrolase [Membranihabitans marinus]|uniref:family 20 glycosylhydrolase n=1 Tax=Membranihabitans marinus TaxID=1227546 RepID=UPI001F22DC91|nr:family 20 glycosylhydrolase [Membranihabitans marinus]
MNKPVAYLFLFLSYWSFLSCADSPISDLSNMQLRYLFEGNDETGQHKATFELINKSTTPVVADWELYFNQITGSISIEPSVNVNIQHINGDLYKITPKPGFNLSASDTLRIPLTVGSPAIKYSDFPSGFYFVNSQNGIVNKIEDLSISVPPLGKNWLRSNEDLIPIPSAATYYDINIQQSNIEEFKHSIIPRPKKMISSNRKVIFNNIKVSGDEVFNNEMAYLKEEIGRFLPELSGDNYLEIEMIHRPELKLSSINDDYQLSVNKQKVTIIASNQRAGFYAIMSLLQLIDPNDYHQPTASLPAVQISDYPSLEYRGFMLDVGRNFKSVDQVLWVIDLLSRYKMNTFHFHITDDEGWRLEIKDLPELTNFGGFRGYSPNESQYLQPSYGSGPEAQPSQVTGYYTGEDFIKILEYAKARHIKVIPEVDMPGHARAAVKSMEHRYMNYKDEDIDKATQYLLSDLEDESEYSSIQQFNDNVINVCKPSTYVFFEKVITQIKEYYDEAGLKLEMVHIGGDEVPHGVWTSSPACDQWIQENGLDRNDLMSDFLIRINQILVKHDILMAGWQEIALNSEHNIDVTKSASMIPYVWNTMPGDPDSPDDSQELAYKLANQDFNIVISSAPNLYFDFAYDKHPDESGFYWSGFIDMEKSFSMQPYDMYTSYSTDPMGHLLDTDHSQKEKLEKKENILGIQGQLWTETVHNFAALQYYLIPKAFGLFERAWNPEPTWQGKPKSKAFYKDWEAFKYNVGKYQIPMLQAATTETLNYRLSPPGGIIKDGELIANSYWPDLEIKYTTDGSEPDRNSKTYTTPIILSNDFVNIKLKAFDKTGYSSRTVTIEPQ